MATGPQGHRGYKGHRGYRAKGPQGLWGFRATEPWGLRGLQGYRCNIARGSVNPRSVPRLGLLGRLLVVRSLGLMWPEHRRTRNTSELLIGEVEHVVLARPLFNKDAPKRGRAGLIRCP